MTFYDEIMNGLQEALDYNEGKIKARTKTISIEPVPNFNATDIKRIRVELGMTQLLFAGLMGVSIKTVEAWEGGRTHPTGPVFRLLDILSAGEEVEYIVAK